MRRPRVPGPVGIPAPADRERPAADRERPAADRERPAADRERPAADRERAAADPQRAALAPGDPGSPAPVGRDQPGQGIPAPAGPVVAPDRSASGTGRPWPG